MARIDNLSNFLTDVATSIKAKTGSTDTLTPAEFDTAIAAIEGSAEGGITPVGTITITKNGDYDVTNYAGATVNVESTGDGGITPEGTITITENGTHDVTNYASAEVNVEGITPEGTLEITTNGEHDVTNYAKANVDIEVGVFPKGELEITENGQHDVTNYASTNVNVPVGVFPEGTLEITDNGTFDVTNYESATVNVEVGTLVPESVSFAEDSWETIRAISEAGLAYKYYKIGDTKKVISVSSIDNGGYYNNSIAANEYEYTVMIVGFGTHTINGIQSVDDKLDEQTGMTLMITEVYEDLTNSSGPTKKVFGMNDGGQYYGWPGHTRLRDWLNNVLYNSFPEELRNGIKSVKTQNWNSYSVKVVESVDYILLPAAAEIGLTYGTTEKEDEYQIPIYFANPAVRNAIWGTQNLQPYTQWLRSGPTDGLCYYTPGSTSLACSKDTVRSISPIFCI